MPCVHIITTLNWAFFSPYFLSIIIITIPKFFFVFFFSLLGAEEKAVLLKEVQCLSGGPGLWWVMHYQRLHCVGELWSTMQGSRGLSVTPHPTPLFCDSRQQINANPHHTLWNMAVVLQKQVVRPNKIFINYLFQIFTAFFYTPDRKCYCFIAVCFLSFSNIFMYWRCGSTSHMELFLCLCVALFFFFFLLHFKYLEKKL